MNEESYLHDHLSHMYAYRQHMRCQEIINAYEADVKDIFIQCEQKNARRRAESAERIEQSRRFIQAYERNLKLKRQG